MHNTFRSSQTNHPLLHIQRIARQVSLGRKAQTPCPSIERINQNMIITQMTVPQTKSNRVCGGFLTSFDFTCSALLLHHQIQDSLPSFSTLENHQLNKLQPIMRYSP